MWDDGLLDALVSAGLANARPHAQHRLDLLFAAGCIDPRQPDSIIIKTVEHYQQLRGRGFASDDALAGLKAAGGPVEVPDLATLEPISY
jgi:hypothetical protein